LTTLQLNDGVGLDDREGVAPRLPSLGSQSEDSIASAQRWTPARSADESDHRLNNAPRDFRCLHARAGLPEAQKRNVAPEKVEWRDPRPEAIFSDVHGEAHADPTNSTERMSRSPPPFYLDMSDDLADKVRAAFD